MCLVGWNFVDEPLSEVAAEEKGTTRNQKKAARKKQKRKEKKETDVGFEIEEVIAGIGEIGVSEDQLDHATISTSDHNQPSVDKDILKRTRNIRKKLKQIEDLEQKISTGDIKPDRDQLNKIAKKQELKEELAGLTT